jgi:hypothetical protein
MVFLFICEFAVTISANNYGFLAKAELCEVMKFQTVRIRFIAINATGIRGSQAFECLLSPSFTLTFDLVHGSLR